MLLEGLVVDDLLGGEGDAPLAADAHRVARKVVALNDLRATRENAIVEVVEVGVCLRVEDLLEVGPHCGHHQGVAVVGADLEDGVVLHHGHDFLGASDGARGQTATQGLGHGHQVGSHSEALGGAARTDAQAGLDLIEDQDDAVSPGDLADLLQISRFRQHDAQVHHGRLHDDAGGLTPLIGQPDDAALHGLGIVEGNRHRHLDGGVGNAASVGQRGQVVTVTDLVVLDADRDHDGVVVPVVGAEDLHDRVATGVGACNTDRVHRGLRARVRVAPLRQPPPAREVLRHRQGVLGRGGEVGALAVPLLNGFSDHRVGMPLKHRSEAVVEVPHLVAVNIPDLRPLPPFKVNGPGLAQLVRGGDTAGKAVSRAVVHVAGPLGPFIEALGLDLRQLSDSLHVDAHCSLLRGPAWRPHIVRLITGASISCGRRYDDNVIPLSSFRRPGAE